MCSEICAVNLQAQDEGRCSAVGVVFASDPPPELRPGGQTRTGHEVWRYACVRFALWFAQRSVLMRVPSLPRTACRALVDEMDWAISQVDPKKMIQTGSFRINPDGSQSIREVSRASLCV